MPHTAVSNRDGRWGKDADNWPCAIRYIIPLPTVGSLIVAIITLAVIALVARQAHAQEPSATGPQAFEPDFSGAACPGNLYVPDDATLTCGYVTVLEDRAKPDGRTIDLYVVRIRGPYPSRHSDPVIYLAGGPGGSASRRTQRFLDDGRFLWTARALLLFDQRGIGRSKPRLECAQYRHEYADIRGRDLDPDEELELRVEALLGCKRTLTDQGIDLGAYTSASTAADVVDIASAMGYESYNLYGGLVRDAAGSHRHAGLPHGRAKRGPGWCASSAGEAVRELLR